MISYLQRMFGYTLTASTREQWQKDGLAPPKAVIDATSAYLDCEDAVAAWLDEECERNPNAWTRSLDLFASWRAYADKCGEPHGNTKNFRDLLEARGIFAKAEPGTKRVKPQKVFSEQVSAVAATRAVMAAGPARGPAHRSRSGHLAKGASCLRGTLSS